MIPIQAKDPIGTRIIVQTPTLFESEHFGIVEEGPTRLLYIYSKNGQRIAHVGTLERGQGIIQRLEANQSLLDSLSKGIIDRAAVNKAAMETYIEIKKKYDRRFRRE